MDSERELANWANQSARLGCPRDAESIKQGAHILSARDENIEFPVAGPSNGWLHRLKNRLPVKRRKKESLSHAASCVRPIDIIKWASVVIEELKADGDEGIINEPGRNLNCDESGFEIDPSGGFAYVEVGTKDVVEVSSNCKKQMSVLFTFSADGRCFNPYIIYEGVRLSSAVKENIPENIWYGMTKNGWQTAESFMTYLVFLSSELERLGVKLPIILWLDGHSSHDTLQVMNLQL